MEAARLVRVAIQQAAIDPRTGTIDMDVIATGKSAAMRQIEGQLAEHIKSLLAQVPNKQLSTQQLAIRIRQEKDIFVGNKELNDALSLLSADGVVEVSPVIGVKLLL
jgi:DNA replication licensing factor MCM4